jgi:hypothetical protein
MTRASTLLLLAWLGGCAQPSTTTDQGASLSSASEHTPTALAGQFRFQGTVQPLGRLTVDVIDMRMADASTRLDAARAEGAVCEITPGNVYRCSKLHDPSAVPTSSLEAIGARDRGLFASFGDVTSAPSIVSQGDSLVEWQISQSGESSVGPFTSYRYLELAGGPVKIVLPGEHGSLELILQDEGHVAKWDDRTVSEGRWRWHDDTALVVLQK